MYDKLTKSVEERLAGTPVLSSKEFVAGKANQSLRAALHSVELAQGRVTEAAIEALPAALHQARQAQHAADAIAVITAQVRHSASHSHQCDIVH